MVQFQNKNFDIELHTNATIGQLAEAVKNMANLNKNYFIQLYAELNGAHILDTELPIINALSPTNAPVNFYAKPVSNHARNIPQRPIPRPDKALADYPQFLHASLDLLALALEIKATKMCSSIQNLLLILPCNSTDLKTAIGRECN